MEGGTAAHRQASMVVERLWFLGKTSDENEIGDWLDPYL
jgi:hypothetical protein